jgi:hypothetical protein
MIEEQPDVDALSSKLCSEAPVTPIPMGERD